MITLKKEGLAREPGKKVTRQIRNSGNVPCVLYGQGQETVHFQMPQLEMRDLVYTDEMHRLELSIDGSSYDCIIRDVDFHPTTDEPIHADFIALQAGRKIKLSIPIQYVGKSIGQKEGGEAEFLLYELEIQCFPKDIPEHVEVNISELNIGDTLHVSDLELENVEILTPDRQSLVTVVLPTIEEEPEEEEELLEGELEEGEEGEVPEGEEGEEASAEEEGSKEES